VMYSTDFGATWTQENSGASATLYGSALYMNPQRTAGVYWAVGSGSVALKNISYPVPVELVAFGASVKDGIVRLSWKTASELNNVGFDIERRSENSTWSKIGFVAGLGTSTAGSEYVYFDKSAAAGKYSYRLRQVDYDGTAEYSGVIEVDLNTPFTFALDQNYPNPFNPVTTVKYQVAEKVLICLKVYDVIGNEVSALVNQEQDAGTYTVRFDAAKTASGIYICKLSAGKFEKSVKMMLLK